MKLSDELHEIREDVRAIRAALFGNGKTGLFERVALLEQRSRVAQYIVMVVIGVAAAVAASIVSRALFP